MSHDTKESLQALLDGGVQYIARVYRVTRRDGTVYRFTDHDTELEVREGWLDGSADVLSAPQTYSPEESWNGSAARAEAALKVANMEFKGAVGSSGISDAELRAGLWDGSVLDVAWVDWRMPWMGLFRHSVYRLTDFKYNEELWVAQASNMASELQRRQGKRYGLTCWHAFMDSACGVSVTPGTTHFKCIVKLGTTIEGNREFECDDIAGAYGGMRNQSTHFFRSGHIKWTSGNNIGQVYPIKAHSTTLELITLQYPCRAEIELGDAFDIWAGCSKTLEVCKSTSLGGAVDNHRQFGGFPQIPGTTQLAKVGQISV